MKKSIVKTLYIAFISVLSFSNSSFAQNWLIGGNTGAGHVLGQTDTNGFNLITNNAARMTLTSGGAIGINTTTPSASFKLQVHNTSADAHMLVSGTAPSVQFSNTVNPTSAFYQRSFLALATSTGGQFVDYSAAGDFIMQNRDTAADILFCNGYGTRSGSPRYGVEQMRIAKNGWIGINMRSYADANGGTLPLIQPRDRFHVYLNNGANQEYVRIENMPAGHGVTVVIDTITGRLYRTSNYQKPARNDDELVKTVEQMKAEIVELRQQIADLKQSLGSSVTPSVSEENFLEQNTPNPFTNTTQISYNVNSNFTSCVVTVFDMEGKKVFEHNVSAKGKGSFTFSGAKGAMYIYNMQVDGKVIASKKMVGL